MEKPNTTAKKFDKRGTSTRPDAQAKKKKKKKYRSSKHKETVECTREDRIIRRKARREAKRIKKAKAQAASTGESKSVIALGPVPPYSYRCVICDIYFYCPMECHVHYNGLEHRTKAVTHKDRVIFELCFYAKPLTTEPFLYYEDRIPKELPSSHPLYSSNAAPLSVDHTPMDVDHAPLDDKTCPTDVESSSQPPSIVACCNNTGPPLDKKKSVLSSIQVTKERSSPARPRPVVNSSSSRPKTRSAVVGSLLDGAKDSEYRRLVYSDVQSSAKYDIGMRCNVCRYTVVEYCSFYQHLHSTAHREKLRRISAVDDIAYEHVTITVKNWTVLAARWAKKLILKRNKAEISRSVQCITCGGSILPHRNQIRDHTGKDRTHLEALAAKKCSYTTIVYERKIQLS